MIAVTEQNPLCGAIRSLSGTTPDPPVRFRAEGVPNIGTRPTPPEAVGTSSRTLNECGTCPRAHVSGCEPCHPPIATSSRASPAAGRRGAAPNAPGRRRTPQARSPRPRRSPRRPRRRRRSPSAAAQRNAAGQGAAAAAKPKATSKPKPASGASAGAQAPSSPPPPPAGWAAPQAGRADGGRGELLGTAVQAVGELAQIGLAYGGQALRQALSRLPKPEPPARERRATCAWTARLRYRIAAAREVGMLPRRQPSPGPTSRARSGGTTCGRVPGHVHRGESGHPARSAVIRREPVSSPRRPLDEDRAALRKSTFATLGACLGTLAIAIPTAVAAADDGTPAPRRGRLRPTTTRTRRASSPTARPCSRRSATCSATSCRSTARSRAPARATASCCSCSTRSPAGSRRRPRPPATAARSTPPGSPSTAAAPSCASSRRASGDRRRRPGDGPRP